MVQSIRQGRGMKSYIKFVDESTFDEINSTVKYDERQQRIYWNDKTFPDATMKEEDVKNSK